MSNRTLALDDRLYDYLLANSLRENAVQRRLREVTAQHESARMQIAPEQGQFMACLVELLGARHILEIGTFTGYSALCMAQAMPANGRLICCDLSSEWTAIGRPYWLEAGVADKIDLRLGLALQTLEQLCQEGLTDHFDLAFIDADKENYGGYFEACLRLVRRGGLILLDNTLWDGAVADRRNNDPATLAIRAINEKLLADERIGLSMVPIGDGLTMAIRRD